MSDHKFVRNRKTGVIFGRNASIEKHPDIEPYFPPAAATAVAAPAAPAPAVAAPAAVTGRRSKKPAASPTTGALAAATTAATDELAPVTGALAAALSLDPEQFTLTGDEPAPLQE